MNRYARQIALPEFGEAGQEKLRAASVLIVGAGGLGSPAATYLAAAGVGTIGLVDFDNVDATNLHRQILYGTSDVGRPKLEAARARLSDLNDEVRIVTHSARLTSENALEILRAYDVVLDGTDNFATRYLVNDACVLLNKPNVYGSVFRFEGQVSVFATNDGPCYRCLYPEPPPPHLVPNCAEGGVLGVLPGIIGTFQATEAIKVIAGIGTTLAGRLLLFDALRMTFRVLKVAKRCDAHAAITRLIDYEEFCSPVHETTDITPAELSERIARGDALVLVDVREPHEWNAGHLASAQHIPLGQLQRRIDEIPRDAEIVMICRSGGRSAHAQQFLQASGYSKVKNLVGGMSRWSREIDPSVRVV
ncbi:MAG: molybdopterin-synthase adenylyltransferase MoeB [Acidobacteria bacterium]|nr:molybdopterin-synthase adenylyltransferase MoeB [Acidobacteriota bacterium]MBV9475875.1 molybdopterin-synthase adenylyltransferase MoeB [Acidobacteriota bacterium]